jgi:outer membrane lipoprotein-sorting protein
VIEREGGHELFSYLPELQKVRRISGHAISGSLFGTDFSYEDFQRLQGTAEGTAVTRLPDADVDGRPAYVLAATPAADSGSSYQRIVTWVDRETCVALRSDLEAGEGRVVKQLRADPAQVRDVAGHRVPHAVVLEDLEKGTRTALTVRKIDLDVELSPSLFSEAALAKGR